MLALFLMVVVSTIVVTTVDTTTLQFTASRNTISWDRARYLAEAGVQHAMAELEADFNWRTGIGATQFPSGSGNIYSVTVVNGAPGEAIITSTGVAGGVTRRIQVTVEET